MERELSRKGKGNWCIKESYMTKSLVRYLTRSVMMIRSKIVAMADQQYGARIIQEDHILTELDRGVVLLQSSRTCSSDIKFSAMKPPSMTAASAEFISLSPIKSLTSPNTDNRTFST